MKKILSCVIVALMLFAMTVPVLAVNINLEVENLSETDIAYDFEYVFLNHYKLEDYKATTKLEAPIIIAVTEQGYEQYFEKGDFTDFALYIYVYNPRMENVTFSSEYNLVQFSTNLYLAEGIQTKKPHISLVDTYGSTNETNESTNGLILKYRVDIPISGISIGSKLEERYYHFSGIELVIDGAPTATDFAVDQKHIFYENNGYLASRVEYPDKVIQLNTKDKHTYYKVMSDKYGAYKDIRSCWFNIPKNYINKYGNLTMLSAIWKECALMPIFVTSNESLYEKYSAVAGEVVTPDTFDGELFFDFSGPLDTDVFSDPVQSYNAPATGNIKDVYYVLAGVFQKSNTSPDSLILSANELDNFLTKNIDNSSIFRSIDDTYYDLENPTKFTVSDMNTLSEYRVSTLWERFWAFSGIRMIKEGDKEFSNITTVDEKDFDKLTNEEFAEKYYVALEDVEDIRADYDSNSVMYLFRYTITDYESYYATEVKNSILTDGTIIKTTAVTQFDIIEVGFHDGYTLSIFPVVHSPIITMPGAYAPPSLPGIDNVVNGVNEFLETMYKILTVIFYVILILIIINIVLKIVNIFKKRKEKK